MKIKNIRAYEVFGAKGNGKIRFLRIGYGGIVGRAKIWVRLQDFGPKMGVVERLTTESSLVHHWLFRR